MKSILTLLSFVLLTVSVEAQEIKNLDQFSKLNVSGDISVQLMQGDPKAEITMTEGNRDELIVEQSGKSLTLRFKNSLKWQNNRSANIVLYNNGDFKKINMSAGSTLESDVEFTMNDCSVSVSSGATLDIIVEAESLDVDVSSGAEASLEGSAQTLNLDVSSGASFNGKTLEASKVDADASSGASAKVWVTSHLSADASSGASVKYKGSPKTTDIDSGKWSGGSVKKM